MTVGGARNAGSINGHGNGIDPNNKSSNNIQSLLHQEFSNPNPDLLKIDQLLSKAKLEIVTKSIINTDAIIDIYEMGAYLAIAKRDGPAFERAIYQLESFYFNSKNEKSSTTNSININTKNMDTNEGNGNGSNSNNSTKENPQGFKQETNPNHTSRKYALMGLYLLYLLISKGNSAFYLCLARFDDKIISDNVFINFAVQLEQALMEGTYNRIEMARSQAPAAEYAWFIDSLMGRIREEIAGCIEEAYEELNEMTVGELLFTNDMNLIREITEKKNWKNQNHMILFPRKTRSQHFDGEKIDSELLIKRSIFYSKHLEQII